MTNEKTNDQLVYEILTISNPELKQQAWEQLLKQSPSNSDLCYLIKYTELKQQAGEQLLKQSPSNSDLRNAAR
jgi:hypothetical protein